MNLPNRKTIRLPEYDYDSPGYYFITICTQDKLKLLCNIVVSDLITGTEIQMLPYGRIAEEYLTNMQQFYGDIYIDKYVIMPNHIHMLLCIPYEVVPDKPTIKKDKISRFIGTFKRLFQRDCGNNIWQYRSYDHVIRNEQDYRKIWNYIDCNPGKWTEDRLYVE